MFNATPIHSLTYLGEEFETYFFSDTTTIYTYLEQQLEVFWKINANKEYARQNYSFDDNIPWALGPMLKKNSFIGGFYIVCRNKDFFACSGLRENCPGEVILMARYLCHRSAYPLGNALMLGEQLQWAKNYGAKTAIISFNNYNQHLVNYYRHILPQKKDSISIRVLDWIKLFDYVGLEEINNTKQHVFRSERLKW